MTNSKQKSPTNKQLNNNSIKSICVFCGSGEGHNPAFKSASQTLGRLFAENNIELIYGGGDMGLMGTIANAVKEKDGKVTGIIPEFLLKYQNENLETTGLIVTKDMHTRKAKMYELADAFIALPGGIGTLEELVETMTWAQLGTHQKPIALLNTANFWQPFLSLIDHMKSENFIRAGLEVNFQVVEQPEHIIDELLVRKNVLSQEAFNSQETIAPSRNNL